MKLKKKLLISILISISFLALFMLYKISEKQNETPIKEKEKTILSDAKNKKLEKKLKKFVAVFEDGNFEFRENQFVDFKKIENSLKLSGFLHSQEKLFVLVDFDKTYKKVIELSDEYLKENSKIISKYEIKNSKLYVDAKSFLEYFSIEIIEKEAYEKVKKIEKEKEEKNKNTQEQSEKKHEKKSDQKPKKSVIYLWDNYGSSSDYKFHESLDVVLPAWIHLKSKEGEVSTVFNEEYFQNLNSQGVDLMVMATNSFDKDMTSAVLNSYEAKTKLINALIVYMKNPKITGLNIDFENIYLKDSDAFVSFIAELSIEMKKLSKTLSVCVTVPGGSDNWSKVYDRDRLAKFSDYLTLMAYDQHWENADVSGPVASYSWVKKHLEDMIKTIPSQKIILGLPFYTRVWNETLSSTKVNSFDVSSRSLYMDSPRKIIKQNPNHVKIWDEGASQYYIAYIDSEKNSIVKFWYDDEHAVARKADLLNTHDLAGLACWAMAYETKELWEELSKVKKNEYLNDEKKEN